MKTKDNLNHLALMRIEVVDEALAAILRSKSPAERVAMTSQAHSTAKALLMAQVLRHHPEWSTDEVSREVARRLIRGTE